MLRHRGVLEEIAPQIGVVWIQELGTGMRIMLDLTETDIRAHPAPPPHRGWPLRGPTPTRGLRVGQAPPALP
ncbi:hypothetical protein [Kocuria rosea]|uniref:hypothetical protein n=1 Tax=Kocuria rosea TaxID=1275 RepID=UPI00301A8FBD